MRQLRLQEHLLRATASHPGDPALPYVESDERCGYWALGLTLVGRGDLHTSDERCGYQLSIIPEGLNKTRGRVLLSLANEEKRKSFESSGFEALG